MRTTVGVRELKAHLSRYLRQVQAGARLTITDHGKAIATLAPVAKRADIQWALDMVARGEATWSGGKPSPPARRARLKKNLLVSDAVIEDRM